MTNEVRRDTFIIEQLFFELLHVSLGIRICLSAINLKNQEIAN